MVSLWKLKHKLFDTHLVDLDKAIAEAKKAAGEIAECKEELVAQANGALARLQAGKPNAKK